MNEPYILNLSDVNNRYLYLVGGKAASLGELISTGLPIPPGFVITTNCYKKFKNQGFPAEVKELILKAFDDLGSERVAVRSSAIGEDSKGASWAGQLETYLNTSKENLIETIRRCWESTYSERALAYASEKNIDKNDLTIGVVIQKMIDSEVSGIMFTANPITNNKNQIMIEAGYGLGELLVQGIITPDNFLLDKKTFQILKSQIETQGTMLVYKNGENIQVPVPEEKKNKAALSEKQLIELARMGLVIEQHYSVPQDIEWAFEKGKFYIVQSRPITTIKNNNVVKSFKQEDYIFALWFQGVSVFVTDIHNDLYKKLEALFIIDNGMFKQYFSKKAYEKALNDGVKFYSGKNTFYNYKKDFTEFCKTFTGFFEGDIKNKESLSEDVVIKFFEYTKKLCGDYTMMNFESTDKAFTLQEENPTIKKNLSEMPKFKEKIRNYMNMVLFEPEGYSYQLFGILSRQFKLPVSVFENLTQKEILRLFEGKNPDEKIVLKRQQAFVESYNLDNCYVGKDAEPILQEFREEIKYSKLIKGQTASKGRVIGKVKIITVNYSDLKRINEEIKKMQKGEILVAETTAPELMAAVKKAGAIVTDMGGLMSHAAIVSREFGIPCIVGTGTASKILKDGDLVEVDADKGIIKIR